MARAAADTYDYIVIGAGSAGCVVAARLSEDPTLKVLLLEAGGKDDHPYVRLPLGFLRAMFAPGLSWGHTSEPIPQLNDRRLPLPRGRLLGGSSSINGLFYMRGHPRKGRRPGARQADAGRSGRLGLRCARLSARVWLRPQASGPGGREGL